MPGTCIWSYQDTLISKNCNEPFNFNALTHLASGDSQLKVVLSNGENVSQDVRVRDRLILGLGDSFGSGEGNPDIPTILNREYIDNLPKKEPNQRSGIWMKNVTKWKEKNAIWLDKQCHRSLYSQHALAGLRLATRDAHESITLLPLACSGAETLDGLLTPQQLPPGGGAAVKVSQVNFAIRELCPDSAINIKKVTYARGESGRNLMKPMKSQDLYVCKGSLRKPDAILLSIGGNDVGFARVIAWAAAADRGRNIAGSIAIGLTKKYAETICPYPLDKGKCKEAPPDARFRVEKWLPKYYEYLNYKLLEAGLICDKNSSKNGCDTSNVYLTAYPTPSYLNDGETLCDVDRSADANEQLRTFIPSLMKPKKWQLQFTRQELSAINVGLIQPITTQMAASSELYNWNFVVSHLDTIKPHGLCEGYLRENGNPQYLHTLDGKWYPVNPNFEKAYGSTRQRWFRSPNDVVLFQTETDKFGISGAYHPDVRAHAAIADAIYEKIDTNWKAQMEKILDKNQ